MSIMKEPATPPPTIGKMGPYTVFVTPSSDPSFMSVSGSPKKKYTVSSTLIQPPPLKSAPLVQPPPVQYHKSTSSKAGFLWDAVAKVQNVHSSLDEYIAHWFGLNQSRYQWALDDYYESNRVDGGGLSKNTFIISFVHNMICLLVGPMGPIYMIVEDDLEPFGAGGDSSLSSNYDL